MKIEFSHCESLMVFWVIRTRFRSYQVNLWRSTLWLITHLLIFPECGVNILPQRKKKFFFFQFLSSKPKFKVIPFPFCISWYQSFGSGFGMAMEFYYTRCSFEGHLFLVAVDQFNFRNVVSSRVVEKLHLPTTNGQATIKFSIGKYEDEVLCDIAPM